MKKLATVLSIGVLSTGFAFAQNTMSDCSKSGMSESCDLKVFNAEVKAPNGNNTEVKMNIKNSGNETVDIIAAYSPIDEKTQLHHFVTNSNGQRVMKQISSIEVYPHNEVDLSFQELHIMLIGLKDKLKKGQDVPVTLILEDGSTISITAKVD